MPPVFLRMYSVCDIVWCNLHKWDVFWLRCKWVYLILSV